VHRCLHEQPDPQQGETADSWLEQAIHRHPHTAPTAPVEMSNPYCVPLRPSRTRAKRTHVANAAHKVMFMTKMVQARVRTPG
jgi:hypothetical protein